LKQASANRTSYFFLEEAGHLTLFLLVLRHARTDPVSPSQNPSREIVDFLESRLAQEVDGLRAADARSAMRDDLLAGIEFVDTLLLT